MLATYRTRPPATVKKDGCLLERGGTRRRRVGVDVIRLVWAEDREQCLGRASRSRRTLILICSMDRREVQGFGVIHG